MRTALAAALLAAVAAPALAEQHQSGPDYQAIQDFFAPASEDAAQAVESGEWRGVAGWMGERAQDDAPIYFKGYALLSTGPSASFEASMKGADLTAMADMAGGPQAQMADEIEDYDLEVDVKAAWQLPDDPVRGEAFAGEVAFYESGSLPNIGAGGEGERSPFSSATVCAVRLTGGEGDRSIALASCEVMAQL